MKLAMLMAGVCAAATIAFFVAILEKMQIGMNFAVFMAGAGAAVFIAIPMAILEKGKLE